MKITRRSLLIAFVLLASACGTPNTLSDPAAVSPAPTTTSTSATLAPPTATPPPTASATPTGIQVTYLPPACQGKAITTAPPTVAPTPGLASNPPIAKLEQIGVFNALANRITETYLYADVNSKEWAGVTARYLAKIVAGLDTEQFYVQMHALVAELGDEHSKFESPSERAAADAALAGNNTFVGIGVLASPLLEKDRATILSVFPDSPAAHAGLKPHDSLLSADGLPLIENGTSQAQRLRGPECTAVVVAVRSPDGAVRRVTIVRARVSGSLPIEARLVKTSDGSRIGYVFVPTFFDATIPGQVRAALKDLAPLDGVILDNRMNGGGSSSVMEPILRYFISGVVGRFVSRAGSRTLSVVADPVENSQRVPLVVLVGKNTVSFGEIFSGILQDSGRAKLAGETTRGNVETLSGVNLPDGSRAWIAQEGFEPARSRASWERIGVKPDVEAAADWDTFTFEGDPGIAAALKLLGRN